MTDNNVPYIQSLILHWFYRRTLSFIFKFHDWIYRNKGKGDTIEKIDAGTETTCHFLKPEYMIEKKMFQKNEKQMGIIPAVLDHLL